MLNLPTNASITASMAPAAETSERMPDTVFTIGHSTHPQDWFIALLGQHGITAVCDVRSMPYSRLNPQFNRARLKEALRACGISYIFLGKELGARSEDPSMYENGKVQFDRLARTDLFREGLDRVLKGTKEHRIALMCVEKEPIDCHRTILVARQVVAQGLAVQHIHAGGRIESHTQVIDRLKLRHGLPDSDLFRSSEQMVAEAYRLQEERMAYRAN